jgi:HSP20 family protein
MSKMLPVRRTESIVDELNALHEQIQKRAYEIFMADGRFGRDVENWLAAERELVLAPPVDVQEKQSEVSIEIAIPGVDPQEIHIDVTREDILVKANVHPENPEGDIDVVHTRSANVFSVAHLPKEIDPDSLTANFKDGILHLTARMAKRAQTRKVEASA